MLFSKKPYSDNITNIEPEIIIKNKSNTFFNLDIDSTLK